VRCVFSREPVQQPRATAGEPDQAGEAGETGVCEPADGTLNCHGYGSSVTVTATFGFVAAGEALAVLNSKALRMMGR
jgi:tRNA threonylcarbamoyladenosine dehydratase